MRLIIATVAIPILAAGACHAQMPHSKTTVETCLAKPNKPNSDSCIGVTSNTCIGPDEGSKPSSEVVACLDAEQKQWDSVLNASFEALRKGLEPAQQARLREMQRAWIASRDSTCQFYMDYFDGSMANPMIANCMNRETARRAIFLKGFAADLAERK